MPYIQQLSGCDRLGERMNKDLLHGLWDRWKTDFEFKTIVSAVGSLVITLIFAIYNGYLGISYESLWYGTICIYYILLVIIRGSLLGMEKASASRENRDSIRKKVYLAGAIWLLILNSSLIIPITLLVRQEKPVNMTLIPAIAMAAYTVLKVVSASVNLKRRKQSANVLVKLFRTINFIDSLVSILTLQNTLIMVVSRDNQEAMLPITAFSSGAIFLLILILSVGALGKGISYVRKKEIKEADEESHE